MNLKVLSTDKEIKNLGVVSSGEEADVLCARAREWISTYGSQQVLDFGRTDMQGLVQEISVEHTRKILGGNIGIVFCGSQNEGFTMIPVVEDFVTRFHLKDFVVVADSGLMTKKNVTLLQSGKYKYTNTMICGWSNGHYLYHEGQLG